MAESLRGTILVVEDDNGIAHLQEVRLKRLGHAVHTVASAAAALDFLSKQPADLIVLDYQIINDISGIDLFLLMRERGYIIPAILVTGFEDPQIIIRAMRAGLRDFLPKSTEFLNELPLSVERLLRQVAIERQAAETATIREKQQILEAAFEAAQQGSFVWNLQTNELLWSDNIDKILGFKAQEMCLRMENFISVVHIADREGFSLALEEAKVNKSIFRYQFRILKENQVSWYSVSGKFDYYGDTNPVRMICVVGDITTRKKSEIELVQSNNRIKALNDRLQLGMVEANHRIKNSLQNVISLLNIEFRKQGSLTEGDVSKLTAHIHGLAALHDILVDQAKVDGTNSTVSLDQVFTRILEVIDKADGSRLKTSSFQSCVVTSRRAASLAVILNELISNAIKHGTGAISVHLENHGETGSLQVKNEGSQFPPNINESRGNSTGMALIKLLCKGDLDSSPQFENISENTARALITFPLEKQI